LYQDAGFPYIIRRAHPVRTLTDKFFQGAKPPAGKAQIEYFDGVTKGLSVIVSAGGARVFYLSYTAPGTGKRARTKLGAYGDLSLAKARDRAREARAAVSEGRDPGDRGVMRVTDLVDSYIAKHATNQRTGDEIARRLRKNVTGVIGNVRLSAVHRHDLTRCIDALMERDAPVEANRVFEDMRAMVRWARGRGDLDENLMEGMRPPAELAARDRTLTHDEIRIFWHKLADAKIDAGTARLLKLILVTLARPGEVAGMTAAELDLERRIWTIPPLRSKTGREHVLPLSDFAVEIIAEQMADIHDAAARRKERLDHQLARLPGKTALQGEVLPEWVFPGAGARAPFTEGVPSKAVKRNAEHFGIEAFRPHDLRRTAATPVRGDRNIAVYCRAPAGARQRHQGGCHLQGVCPLRLCPRETRGDRQMGRTFARDCGRRRDHTAIRARGCVKLWKSILASNFAA
jgi:integrase